MRKIYFVFLSFCVGFSVFAEETTVTNPALESPPVEAVERLGKYLGCVNRGELAPQLLND